MKITMLKEKHVVVTLFLSYTAFQIHNVTTYLVLHSALFLLYKGLSDWTNMGLPLL